MYPSTIILYLLNLLSFKKCVSKSAENYLSIKNSTLTDDVINLINKNECSSKEQSKVCN
jgi:hypothetical protein